jgi:hypothetical protein
MLTPLVLPGPSVESLFDPTTTALAFGSGNIVILGNSSLIPVLEWVPVVF